MTNLHRRLAKLEVRIIDRLGLVPYSTAWIEYWRLATDRILSGEDNHPAERIPIEFVDIVLAEAYQEDLVITTSI
jgi:hypothetical protein